MEGHLGALLSCRFQHAWIEIQALHLIMFAQIADMQPCATRDIEQRMSSRPEVMLDELVNGISFGDIVFATAPIQRVIKMCGWCEHKPSKRVWTDQFG